MGRTKLDKEPELDIIKAMILLRKQDYGYTYEQIAKKVGVHPVWLRTLMTTKHTKEWSPDILRAVCRLLRINITTTLTMVTEDQSEVRIG